MLSFTLDTNCIIDVAEKRQPAGAIEQLVQAHRNRDADVAFVSVSASERQKGDAYLDSYDEFKRRIADLGLGDVPLLGTIAHFGIGFWGIGIYGGSPAMIARERLIHESLFAAVEYEWPRFAARMGLAPDNIRSPLARRWRNAFCDRQMYWAHDHNNRDWFVTSDKNFFRLVGHAQFPNAQVCRPEDAINMLG